MKDFLLLVKAIKANSFTINRKKKGKTIKSKTFSFSMLLIGLIISLSFALSYLSFILSTKEVGLSPVEYEKYITLSFSGFYLFGFFLCLTFSCTIFYGNNNEPFLSLPISGNKLFLAKLFLSLFYNLVYGGLTIIVIEILTCVLLHLSIISYIYAIIMSILYTIVAPCLSFLILDFFSIFINFKNKKAIIAFTTISGILATFFACIASSGNELLTENMTKEEVIQVIENLSSYFTWVSWVGILPTKSLLQLNSNANLLFLSLLLISLIIISLAIFVSRKNYLSLLTKSIKSNKKKLSEEEIKKKLDKSVSNLNKTNKLALKREFSNYKNEGSILINAFIMPIIMLLSLSIVILSLKYNEPLIVEDNVFQIMGIGFMFLTCCFYVIPYTSLSLEKKDLLLLKTLPYSQKRMVYIKLLPSFILYSPIIFINILVYLFVDKVILKQ